MPEEKIGVIAYSGYRGEETPRRIILHGDLIEVVEILDRWVEEESVDRTTKRFFRVKGSEGTIHKIHYDNGKLEWFLKTED